MEGRTTKKREARFEPLVCRGQFYKIRVPMVRWFTRSELRLVASRKDERDRAVDHKSLEDAVVMSHGTDHSLGLLCPCQMRI